MVAGYMIILTHNITHAGSNPDPEDELKTSHNSDVTVDHSSHNHPFDFSAETLVNVFRANTSAAEGRPSRLDG